MSGLDSRVDTTWPQTRESSSSCDTCYLSCSIAWVVESRTTLVVHTVVHTCEQRVIPVSWVLRQDEYGPLGRCSADGRRRARRPSTTSWSTGRAPRRRRPMLV